MKNGESLLCAVLLLALCSCQDADPWRWATTPMGQSVGWKGAPPPAEVVDNFDAALDRAVNYLLRYEGTDLESVWACADSLRYYVEPGPFQTDDSSTNWASGIAYIGFGAVAVAWRISGNPYDAPALGHELGHMYFNSYDFEHAWRPPLKPGAKQLTTNSTELGCSVHPRGACPR